MPPPLKESQAYRRFSLNVSRTDEYIKSPLYTAERLHKHLKKNNRVISPLKGHSFWSPEAYNLQIPHSKDDKVFFSKICYYYC